MADNIAITAGTGTTVATDDIAGVHFQKVLVANAAGAVVDPVAAGSAAMAASVPVTIATNDTQFDSLKARVSPRQVTVTMTMETTALDAGDVSAATQIVAACTPGNDICGVLHSISISDPDDQKAALTFIVFNANTTLGTEDAAPDIDDTELLTCQSFVEIATTDYKDLGTGSIATVNNLGRIVKPATGTDDIYIAIMNTATPTYAGGALTVHLGFL